MKEYLTLLAQRESKVVLGKRYSNLWILSLVLLATFSSIAFSNGSMLYLNEKMNDPFTNWVNIQKGSSESDNFENLRSALKDKDVQNRYLIQDVQGDNYIALMAYGYDNHQHVMDCRFFERLESDIVHAIFNTPGNVIAASESIEGVLHNNSLGFIITLDKLLQLGYSVDSIPSFIYMLNYCPGADTLGVEMVDGDFAAEPFPLLGVVKRLPMNMDLVASHYWYEQRSNPSHPFSLHNESYQKDVWFYVNKESDSDFHNCVTQVTPESLKSVVSFLPDPQSGLATWRDGTLYHLFLTDANVQLSDIQSLARKISSSFSPIQVQRVYNYDVSEKPLAERRLLSVSFARLDSIRSFEAFAKEKYQIQIEMSQVNSKENFNSVRIMASILSWAMIVFSIICIILFIVNMLQSYFQKVKRNMGTFKAFGISTIELIETYVIILMAVIAVAVLLSVVSTTFIQLALHYMGIMKDGQFDYLSLWSEPTIWYAICIIVLATVLTVYIVMNRLLKQTPGDLIYDR